MTDIAVTVDAPKNDANLQVNFLDSEATIFSQTDSLKVTPKRPWSLFWPPVPGDALHNWLKAECPGVLSWRFDPSQPFDRPWQKWTLDARRSGRTCPSTVLPAAALKPHPASGCGDTLAHTSNGSLEPIEDGEFEGRRAMAVLLDRAIKDWGLIAVTPRTFHYLASHAMYVMEKPFHSRLPFLNGLRRTNVIGQAYENVLVHDVTGFEEKFSLSESGFQFLRVPTTITDWNAETVRQTYLSMMEGWLKEFFGSDLVRIYTHNFRSLDKKRTLPEA
ncbi:hypothetical protein BDV96DRAFT_650453 [Lophiotrema nucula]|uniref:Uncharacterized protein n=1 Tax=Lophiotrema nucula TaxID=690887 RepID=A0A6A5YV10_9PLEO|nr:hypothetical protein BDV96DRAFT_650453 [Lophiotrema nucula]